MSGRITTVSTKGQWVIPVEIRASLGIEPGTWISGTLKDSRIVLQPVSEELMGRTRGLFARGSSLSAALKQARQKDMTYTLDAGAILRYLDGEAGSERAPEVIKESLV